jgi:hypothetical protein
MSHENIMHHDAITVDSGSLKTPRHGGILVATHISQFG